MFQTKTPERACVPGFFFGKTVFTSYQIPQVSRRALCQLVFVIGICLVGK